MSPTVIVCVCAVVVACAALAAAGPIHKPHTDLHFENAFIKSASEKQFLTADIDESKRISHSSGSMEAVQIPASDLDREVTSYTAKRRIRRNIMSNGKCAQGYVKIGKTCMDCKELDSCD